MRPRGATGLAGSPEGGAPGALLPSDSRGPARTRMHGRAHRPPNPPHTHTHGPAPYCPAGSRPPPLRKPRIRPPSYRTPRGAERGSPAHERVHPRPHAPPDPGGGSSTPASARTRAHADPRTQGSPRSAVFFMNENVVCK